MAVAGEHYEVERSYAAMPGAALPDFRVGAITDVADPVVHELVATYYDTEDLRLARARLTLRRREGGSDDGWHIKLPGGQSTRVELRRPLGSSARPPAAIRQLLEGVRRGAPLVPLVELRTHREERQLLSSAGGVLAVVADDLVRSRQLPAETEISWREIEVELVDGDADLLDLLGAAMQATGLPLAQQQSKLRRALGERAPEPASGHPLVDYLAEHWVALLVQDVLTRAGAPDGVHRQRIAARRLRSALRSYRRLLVDADEVRVLVSDLRWLGRELAGERDLEVAQAQLHELLDTEAAQAGGVGRARQVVRRDFAAEARTARTRTKAALSSNRYLALLDRLARVVAEPPLGWRAARPPTREMRRGVSKAYAHLERLVAATADAGKPGSAEREHALHDVRKAAKRLRYVCEVAEPALGKRARRLRRRTKRLQSVLGEHQDTVVLRGRLERLGRHHATPASAAFVFGRLHAREQADAAVLSKRARQPWARVHRQKASGWVR